MLLGTKSCWSELKEQLGGAFTLEVADVADTDAAMQMVAAAYRPQTIVLNADATLRSDRFSSKPGKCSAPTGAWMSDTSSTSRKSS